MPTTPLAPLSTRPLIVTGDPDLLDDLLRLAAAASIDVEVAAYAGAAQRSWHRAPLVVVGDDQLEHLLAAAPRRRSAVIIAHRALIGGEPEAAVWRHAVALGAEHVVSLPAGENFLVERFAVGGDVSGSEARVLALVGGRGGAGTSTLAAATALLSARSLTPTLLVDGDPWGGGVDLALGIEESPGLRWGELAHTMGRVSAGALGEVLPRCEQLSVLSWGASSSVEVPRSALVSLFDAAVRGFGLVVADLARGSSEVNDEVMKRASMVCVVVPREIRAVAAAHRTLAALEPHGARIVVVTRGPSPSGLDPRAVADSLGCELVGDLRTDARLAAAVERGEPPCDRPSVARVAAAIVTEVTRGQAIAA